jgi:hypothetical protein
LYKHEKLICFHGLQLFSIVDCLLVLQLPRFEVKKL